MRILFPPGQRSNWFDRNAVTLVASYNAGGAAAHAATTRWTYTVPAAKKYLIGSAMIHFYRDIAPTTPADAYAAILIPPRGGAATAALRCFYDLSPISSPQIIAGLQGEILFAADTIAAQTADGSTGGTFSYSTHLAGAEFDA